MRTMILSCAMLALAGAARAAEPAVEAAAPTAAVAQDAPAASATCTYRVEPAVTASPAKTTKTTLTMLAVNPAADADVTRATTVSFDLEFHIADFAKNTFFLMPLFETAGEGWNSAHGPADYPPLEAAAGKVHLCVPLAELYDAPTIHWPLRISVSLMRLHADGASSGQNGIRAVKFNSVDIPAEALARQAEQPPIEYHDALKKVTGFFETRLARYKACNQRFPAQQPQLTKAYRSWEARHADTVQYVAGLQFDHFLFLMNGNVASATAVFDASRDANLRAYTDMAAGQLRQQCEYALSEFQDPDDTTDMVIGDEVAYLRKWNDTHKKAKP
jgi:hypothetical protein